MTAGHLALGLLAALAGCASIGGEQFSHVAPPSSLKPTPHTAAELEPFTIYHGPGSDERVRNAWQNRFLAARLNRAFAASEHHFGFAFGYADADAAAAKAMEGCARSPVGPGEAGCVLYAINTEIVYPPAAYTLPFRGRALGPFTPSPEFTFHGPATAKGIIVWSHGTGRACADNGARFAPPAVITLMNQAGWDVVRFDRDPCADDLSTALRRMPAGIDTAAQAGYRKIVLSGQSRGAMQSFELLRDPATAAKVSAVIGFSPAASGDSVYASTVGPQRWLADASAVGGSMPAAVFFFSQDPFNPLAGRLVETTRQLWRTQLPNGHAYFNDDPAMVGQNGHGAATSPAFTAKYAACLLGMIDDGAAIGPCAE